MPVVVNCHFTIRLHCLERLLIRPCIAFDVCNLLQCRPSFVLVIHSSNITNHMPFPESSGESIGSSLYCFCRLVWLMIVLYETFYFVPFTSYENNQFNELCNVLGQWLPNWG